MIPAQTAELLNRPRWVYGKGSTWPLTQGCPCCGSMHSGRHQPCPPTECLLCGTVQCHSTHADCRVCYVGWLPGWYRGSAAESKLCSRKDCKSEAVATVRKRRLCRDHAMATTYGPRRIPMAGHLAAQIAHRDSGKGWEHWVFTGPRVAWEGGPAVQPTRPDACQNCGCPSG